MRTRLTFAVVLAGILAAVAQPAAPSQAAASATTTRTWTYAVDTQQLTRTVGSDKYYDEVAINAYGGGLSGVATDHDDFVMHKDGVLVSHNGVEFCASCTLGGKT